jgi:hypothetical protein
MIEPLEMRIAPATFVVTSVADAGDGSLRDALQKAEASPGADLIKFKKGLSGGVVLAASLPDITQDLAIKGPGSGKLAIDGAGAHQILEITGGTVSLSGLNFFGGLATEGGALAVRNADAEVKITRCAFVGNLAAAMSMGGAAAGGAIFIEAGKVVIQNSVISANAARGADGLDQPNAQVNTNGAAGGVGGSASGGGIANFGTLTMKKTLVIDNIAIGGGGGDGGNGGATPGPAGRNWRQRRVRR